MTWVSLARDIRDDFASFEARSAFEILLAHGHVDGSWSTTRTRKEGFSREEKLASRRRYARSEKGKARQRARRATPEGRKKHCEQEKARKAKRRRT